jgi:RNA polymerase sigma factor (sigma-70 family)
MRDDLFVADLITRAGKGHQQAWDVLVERYSSLIWSICRHYRLSRAEAEDVGQRTWLQFVNHLGAIRDPAALRGWLTTATRRECNQVVLAGRGPQAAGQLLDENVPDKQTRTAEQDLLAAERHAALSEAFTCLSPSHQQLMALLIEDPPVPYTEISARLGIPVSSIGPTRCRCLDQLRRHLAVAALIDAEDWTAA